MSERDDAPPKFFFLRRVGAFLVDFMASTMAISFLFKMTGLVAFGLAAFVPGWFVTWFLYHFLCLGLAKGSWGTNLMELQVVRMDGSEPGWPEARLRALTGVGSAAALFLGYLWALLEKDGRGWHDLAAGTIVESK